MLKKGYFGGEAIEDDDPSLARGRAVREKLTVQCFLEAIIACHLSSYVESPFPERGGLMLVGPPGVLKSAMLSVLDTYADALILSDVNARSLGHLKNLIAQGSVRTLVLPEMQKVYERAEHTSSNVEGTIRALVAEGWSAASYEDATIQRLRARALVIGAMTPDTYEEHSERWAKSGFSRRFVWSLLTTDTGKLDQAAVDGEPIDMGHHPSPAIATLIHNSTTGAERQELRVLTKYQPSPHASQIHTLIKMLAAWKWWYGHIHRNRRSAMVQMRAWAATLGRHGAYVHI